MLKSAPVLDFIMKKLILSVVFLLVGAAVSLLVLNRRDFNSLSVGMRKSDVLAKVGTPDGVYKDSLTLLKNGGEVWAYGPRFDFSSVLRLESPIVYRFVLPNDGDEVIIFDANDNVRLIINHWGEVNNRAQPVLTTHE
jgi:hypothetical protein